MSDPFQPKLKAPPMLSRTDALAELRREEHKLASVLRNFRLAVTENKEHGEDDCEEPACMLHGKLPDGTPIRKVIETETVRTHAALASACAYLALQDAPEAPISGGAHVGVSFKLPSLDESMREFDTVILRDMLSPVSPGSSAKLMREGVEAVLALCARRQRETMALASSVMCEGGATVGVVHAGPTGSSDSNLPRHDCPACRCQFSLVNADTTPPVNLNPKLYDPKGRCPMCYSKETGNKLPNLHALSAKAKAEAEPKTVKDVRPWWRVALDKATGAAPSSDAQAKGGEAQ